jgi:hypothetical protein
MMKMRESAGGEGEERWGEGEMVGEEEENKLESAKSEIEEE